MKNAIQFSATALTRVQNSRSTEVTYKYKPLLLFLLLLLFFILLIFIVTLMLTTSESHPIRLMRGILVKKKFNLNTFEK